MVPLKPDKPLRRSVQIGGTEYRIELTDTHVNIVAKGAKVRNDIAWDDILKLSPVGYASRAEAFAAPHDAQWAPRRGDVVWVRRGLGCKKATVTIERETRDDVFVICRQYRVYCGGKVWKTIAQTDLRPKRGGGVG